MQKTDYEQLYFDALYEIKKLKQIIEELECDLKLINKNDMKRLELKKEIIKELKAFYRDKKEA